MNPNSRIKKRRREGEEREDWKKMSRHFTKKNKITDQYAHEKKYSIPLVIRKMQIKAIWSTRWL